MGSPPPIREANGGEGSGVGGACLQQMLTEQRKSPPPGSLRSPPSPPLAYARGGEGWSKRHPRYAPCTACDVEALSLASIWRCRMKRWILPVGVNGSSSSTSSRSGNL